MNHDRWFVIQPYRWFPSIMSVLTIVRPETLGRRHRVGFSPLLALEVPIFGRPTADRHQAAQALRVKPVIGHLKSERRMGRNCLWHRQGDAANVVLAAVGYYFRLLRWRQLLLSQILVQWSFDLSSAHPDLTFRFFTDDGVGNRRVIGLRMAESHFPNACKTHKRQSYLGKEFNALLLAGAGGIELPNGGIKIR
jgi:hypothetical protein